MIKLFYESSSKLKIFLLFVLAGLILYFPLIFGNFYNDDYLRLNLLKFNDFNSLMETKWLKWFFNYDNAIWQKNLWWFDHSALINFLRPVPAFLMNLFYILFGNNSAIPLHILSIVLHSFVSFTVFLLIYKLSENFKLAILSGFIFLICEDNLITIGWISASTDLYAVAFANLSIYFYLLYRENTKLKHLMFSNVSLVFSLLCKETAVVVPIIILLYELMFQTKSENGFPEKLKLFFGNWNKWIIPLGILIIFIIIYNLGDYGGNTLLYFDPIKNPQKYFGNLAESFFILITGFISPISISFTAFSPELKIPFAMIGILLTSIIVIVIFANRKNKILVFASIIFFITLIPQFSTYASSRLLYFPLVFGSYIIGFIISRTKFFIKYIDSTENIKVKKTENIFGYYLLIATIIIPLLSADILSYVYLKSFRKTDEYVLKSIKIIDDNKPMKTVFLNTNDPIFSFYFGDVAKYHTGNYPDVSILSDFNGNAYANIKNDSCISIRSDKAGWVGNIFAEAIRTNQFLKEGDIYKNKNITAKIIKVTPDGKDVLEVEFFLNFSIRDKNVLVMYFDGNEFKKFDVDSIKYGEWIHLGDTSDPLKYIM